MEGQVCDILRLRGEGNSKLRDIVETMKGSGFELLCVVGHDITSLESALNFGEHEDVVDGGSVEEDAITHAVEMDLLSLAELDRVGIHSERLVAALLVLYLRVSSLSLAS